MGYIDFVMRNKKIVSHFKVLLAEKEVREGRKLTYDVINQETGIHKNALTGYANDTIKRFDRDVIERLCDYFACDIGDLLVLQRN